MNHQKYNSNVESAAPKKWNQFLDFFRIALKRLFENNSKIQESTVQNDALLFSEVVDNVYFWKQNSIHENWQKNLDQFINNIWLHPKVLDEKLQKHILQEQQNMSITDYHLDDLSFTTWIHELFIKLMIEDLQSYLWSKNTIFLVDLFSGTYSIPWVIKPFQTAFWLTWYLWIDMQDALRAESTQKAFLRAEDQWVYTWFLQTDAYSGLCLLPNNSVDVLLMNWVDYTITSDTYMQKVMMQAKKVLKQDGIISGIWNSFLHSPSRTAIHLLWYHVRQIGSNSYCILKK